MVVVAVAISEAEVSEDATSLEAGVEVASGTIFISCSFL